ncbi:MAG: serine hydrolase [Candidatus Daviesbacteria bacterium]|nr:serine hydrolase [Candidatus Daviesbacteria bacterium]
MKFRIKFFIIVLLFLAGALVVYHFSKQSSIFSVEFENKVQNDPGLEKIISTQLNGKKGTFAIFIEELEATSAGQTPEVNSVNTKTSGVEGEVLPGQTSPAGQTPEVKSVNTKTSGVELRKYALNENEFFPSASLYKLILLASVMKEIEASRLKLEDTITGSKTDLTNRLGSLDFGYEDMPENLEFSVKEILERIGRISDNFASIMLTDKLRSLDKLSVIPARFDEASARRAKAGIQENKNWIPGHGSASLTTGARDDNGDDPLVQMAKELGMENTSFDLADIGPTTTASDIALYFRKLYKGEIVSKVVSDKIIGILALNQINDRIPAKLPENVNVIHKTGELALIRHDAGLVFPNLPNSPNHPYLIILLSKDLEFEDDGVETLANISKGVWDYFNKGGPAGN